MNKYLVAALAIATVGLLGVGCGDDDADDDVIVADDFEDFDLDDDGVISAAEWDDTIDTWELDDDGVLEDNEFLMNDSIFSDMDLDDDDVISTAEWNDAFDDLDDDSDGFIDDDEFF